MEEEKKKGKEGGINREQNHMAKINWPENMKQIHNFKYYIMQMKLKILFTQKELTGSRLMWFL